jgi:hypothetical protein
MVRFRRYPLRPFSIPVQNFKTVDHTFDYSTGPIPSMSPTFFCQERIYWPYGVLLFAWLFVLFSYINKFRFGT